MYYNKKIDLIYVTSITDTTGIVVRLEFIKFLSENFKLTIYTNQENLIKNQIHNAKVNNIDFIKGKFPIISDFIYCKKISKLINSNDSLNCIIFHDLSLVLMFLTKNVWVYTIQYGYRSKNFKNTLSKILYKLNENLLFHFLKKAYHNFVVSNQLLELYYSRGIKNVSILNQSVDTKKYLNVNNYQVLEKIKELKNNNYFIVTYSGWFSENRGFSLMLDSIKKIATLSNDVVFVFAGADDQYFKKINKYTFDNNLQTHIINLGKIDSFIIPSLLKLSDVCLSFLEDIPAHYYSPPQKVLEYFAAGKPVICNKIITHETYVKDYYNGFLIDLNVDELVDKIILIESDHNLKRTLSENALISASNYDINNVYSELVTKIKCS